MASEAKQCPVPKQSPFDDENKNPADVFLCDDVDIHLPDVSPSCDTEVQKPPFQCRYCYATFAYSRTSWQKHEELHIMDDSSFKCLFCDETFKSHASLIDHNADVHNRTKDRKLNICSEPGGSVVNDGDNENPSNVVVTDKEEIQHLMVSRKLFSPKKRTLSDSHLLDASSSKKMKLSRENSVDVFDEYFHSMMMSGAAATSNESLVSDTAPAKDISPEKPKDFFLMSVHLSPSRKRATSIDTEWQRINKEELFLHLGGKTFPKVQNVESGVKRDDVETLLTDIVNTVDHICSTSNDDKVKYKGDFELNVIESLLDDIVTTVSRDNEIDLHYYPLSDEEGSLIPDSLGSVDAVSFAEVVSGNVSEEDAFNAIENPHTRFLWDEDEDIQLTSGSPTHQQPSLDDDEDQILSDFSLVSSPRHQQPALDDQENQEFNDILQPPSLQQLPLLDDNGIPEFSDVSQSPSPQQFQINKEKNKIVSDVLSSPSPQQPHLSDGENQDSSDVSPIRHIMVQKPPFQCRYCYATFVRSYYTCQKHEELHVMDDGSLKCLFCDETFQDHVSLISHNADVHNRTKKRKLDISDEPSVSFTEVVSGNVSEEEKFDPIEDTHTRFLWEEDSACNAFSDTEMEQQDASFDDVFDSHSSNATSQSAILFPAVASTLNLNKDTEKPQEVFPYPKPGDLHNEAWTLLKHTVETVRRDQVYRDSLATGKSDGACSCLQPATDTEDFHQIIDNIKPVAKEKGSLINETVAETLKYLLDIVSNENQDRKGVCFRDNFDRNKIKRKSLNLKPMDLNQSTSTDYSVYEDCLENPFSSCSESSFFSLEDSSVDGKMTTTVPCDASNLPRNDTETKNNEESTLQKLLESLKMQMKSFKSAPAMAE